MGGYLNFITVDKADRPGYKTLLVYVDAAKTGDRLGEIRWYGAWRQYTFWPKSGTIFNSGCMREIADKCALMTYDHKSKK